MYNIYIYDNFNEDATHKKIFLAKEKDGKLVAPSLEVLNPTYTEVVSNVFNGQRNSVDVALDENKIKGVATGAQKIAIDDNLRTRWYDVTGFDLIAKNTVRFYITPDDFHTYFCTAEHFTQAPTAAKINTITGNLVQSNAAKYKDNALYPSSSAIGNKVISSQPLFSLLKWTNEDGTTEPLGFRIVAVFNYTIASNSVSRNFTRSVYTKGIYTSAVLAESVSRDISSAAKIKVFYDGNLVECDAKCLNIYIVSTVLTLPQKEVDVYYNDYKLQYTIAGINFTDAVGVERDIDFSKISNYDDTALNYQIGTYGNRVTIPFNHKNLIAKIKFSATAECSIILQVGNQFADITSEFEFAVIENDYARYLSENKNGRLWKYIGTGVSLIKSVTSGNVGAIAGAVVSAGSTIATEKDRAAQAYNVNLPTPASLNLFDKAVAGLAFFVVEPQDYNERKVNFETYGGNCQLLPVTFTNATGSDTAVGFFKCDNVRVDTYMHAPDSAKENIKNLFQNGVFLFE